MNYLKKDLEVGSMPEIKQFCRSIIMKMRKIRLKMIIIFFMFNLVLAVLLAPFIILWGPFEATKTLVVGSILTSQHPQFVRVFLSAEQIDEIVHKSIPSVLPNTSAGITIEDITGRGFKGKAMLIKDPERMKVAVTNELGITGERVSDFVKDTGAVGGINAGAFYDPNSTGNGAFPEGITVHNGEIVHNNIGNLSTGIVGFDKKGKLIVGQMNADDVKINNIQEAVSFWPPLIQDGKPGVFSDEAWGVAPRTAIGQKADGTIILVVIDGQLPTSHGARMSDLVNVFMEYGAVNAGNLDGGSSSEMVYNGKVINSPCDIFIERDLPTAFVVMPELTHGIVIN